MQKLVSTQPDGSTLLQHIQSSLITSTTGFLLAVAVGVPLGLFMGWKKILDQALRPTFDVFRHIPSPAWIPFSILWFGIGVFQRGFIVWQSAFVPVVINSYYGIRNVNQVYIEAAKVFGFSEWEIFRKIYLPASLPQVFTGVVTAYGISWFVLTAAEFLASTEGSGYMIWSASRLGRTDLVVLGMLLIGLIGSSPDHSYRPGGKLLYEVAKQRGKEMTVPATSFNQKPSRIRLNGRVKDLFVYLLPVVVVLSVWYLASFASNVLPTPWETISKIGYMATHPVAGKTLLVHIQASLFRMGIGLIIGISLGVPLGIFMGWNRYFEAAVQSLFPDLPHDSISCLIPLSILVSFGTSELGKIFIIIIAAFPPRGAQLVARRAAGGPRYGHCGQNTGRQ